MHVDLLFPARGGSLPADHGYPLYAALSRLIPAFHKPNSDIRFASITGVRGEPGRMQLTDHSRLRVRLPSDAIPHVLPLAGKALEIAGATVRLGTPNVLALTPASVLISRLVTFKHGEDPETFLATANAKLKELEIKGEPGVPVIESGPRKGEARRRVLRLKGQRIVGYALVVSGLDADESIRLQERGLGGRTRIGCGFFLPGTEETT
jgi:CRISPR-associated protein Cas6